MIGFRPILLFEKREDCSRFNPYKTQAIPKNFAGFRLIFLSEKTILFPGKGKIVPELV
jgi:hypothetical protein